MRKFNITVNGISYEVDVEEVSGVSAAPVSVPATAPVSVAAPQAAAAPAVPKPAAPAPAPQPAPKAAAAAGSLLMKSPMPGTIVDVKVVPGAVIKKGTVLLVLEAMKMENEITAPRDGVVATVNVTKGVSVNSGDLMLSLT